MKLKVHLIRGSLPIRKETGIGRTVNSCRKLDGEVAELATALVEKWKALVSESENDVSSRGNSSEYNHILFLLYASLFAMCM